MDLSAAKRISAFIITGPYIFKRHLALRESDTSLRSPMSYAFQSASLEFIAFENIQSFRAGVAGRGTDQVTLDIVLKFKNAAESIQTRLTRMMGRIYCLFGLKFEHNLAWTIGSVSLP